MCVCVQSSSLSKVAKSDSNYPRPFFRLFYFCILHDRRKLKWKENSKRRIFFFSKQLDTAKMSPFGAMLIWMWTVNITEYSLNWNVFVNNIYILFSLLWTIGLVCNCVNMQIQCWSFNLSNRFTQFDSLHLLIYTIFFCFSCDMRSKIDIIVCAL